MSCPIILLNIIFIDIFRKGNLGFLSTDLAMMYLIRKFLKIVFFKKAMYSLLMHTMFTLFHKNSLIFLTDFDINCNLNVLKLFRWYISSNICLIILQYYRCCNCFAQSLAFLNLSFWKGNNDWYLFPETKVLVVLLEFCIFLV